MKLMIASDIHGSAKYCRQLLEAYDEADKHNFGRYTLSRSMTYTGIRT